MNPVIPIAFKANVVAYPIDDTRPMSIAQAKELVDSGHYTIEFIMPVSFEPAIIIKPNDTAAPLSSSGHTGGVEIEDNS